MSNPESPSPARVVNIRRESCDVYIGRGRGSPWGNPYSHRDGTLAKHRVTTLAEALERYEAYIRSSPELMARLPELRGKRLGCFCKPAPCHGDILVKPALRAGLHVNAYARAL